MKKKNILFFMFLFITLFGTVGNYKAKTIYTTYNKGDKITVNVNDNTQLNFYVIESSNNQNVTAIYDGVLGEKFYFAPTTSSIEGSAAQIKLNELTENWNNPSEIRLIKVKEIDPNFELSSDLSEDITEPSYYHIGESYWTQDVIESETGVLIPIVVTSWSSFSNIHTTTSTAPTSGGNIRPVITIAKEYVVGGSYVLEEEELWNDFVEKFKNTELFKTVEESNTVSITNTDDSLKIVTNDGTNTITTNFTYVDGILTFVPSNNKDNILVDGIWVINCMYALSDLKGYDMDDLDEWYEDNNEYTLANNGLELKEEKTTITNEGIILSVDKIVLFKLDIKNGIKSFSNKEENPKDDVDKVVDKSEDETIENPKTGSKVEIIVIAAITMFVIGSTISINMKKINKISRV